MIFNKTALTIGMASALALASCSGGTTDVGSPDTNAGTETNTVPDTNTGTETNTDVTHTPLTANAGFSINAVLGESFTLSGEANNAVGDDVSYVWTVDGDELPGAEREHIFYSAGTYEVTLTVKDDGSTAIDTVTVNVVSVEDKDENVIKCEIARAF